MQRLVERLASECADIVLLQEVSSGREVSNRLRELFARRLNLDGWFYSGAPEATEKRYGNVIASRFPVHSVAQRPTPDAPWPQLLAHAKIDSPLGWIDAVSVHMPNGSGNGWSKIETFEALGALIADSHRARLLVGGDFNEPQSVTADNGVISFGADEDGVVSGHWRDRQGRRHPTARWQIAVEGILGPRSPIQHTWLTGNRGAVETTHVVRGRERFFDHILASRDHFQVVDAGYHHEWRTKAGLSDHSAAWAVVRSRQLRD